MAKPLIGIQLYSVRDRSEKDFLGTIREMGEIGYRYVEFAGYYGVSARELRQTLVDAGIQAPSAHVGLSYDQPDKLQDNLKQQIEYALELGLSSFVVPSYPVPEKPTLDDAARMADVLASAAQTVKEAGLTFGYHNHDFEFKLVDGKPLMDHVLERVPADLMFMEFDLGWVQLGGQDPAAYVNKYAGRVPIVHAKDFYADRSDAGIGEGIVDWDAALAACEQAGTRYVIVEQEGYKVSSYESAKQNFAFFQNRGWV